MAPKLTPPAPRPPFRREEQFTDQLGTYFSGTRGGADQRALSKVVKNALRNSTSDAATLNGKWLATDSWHWTSKSSMKPDSVVSDDADYLALVLEGKSPRASANWPTKEKARRVTATSSRRVAEAGQRLDSHSLTISASILASEPAWDGPHLHEECGEWSGETHWHKGPRDQRGRVKAAVHQGDVYTSQIAYLPDSMLLPSDGLSSVDFIALLPNTRSARNWGFRLVSEDRWRIASVEDFLAGLEAGREELDGPQLAWLEQLIDLSRAYYGTDMPHLPQLVSAYRESRGTA